MILTKILKSLVKLILNSNHRITNFIQKWELFLICFGKPTGTADKAEKNLFFMTQVVGAVRGMTCVSLRVFIDAKNRVVKWWRNRIAKQSVVLAT